MLQLVRVKPKPREHVAFVVDDYMNVMGILAVRPDRAGTGLPASLGHGTLGQPQLRESDERILPREKFAVLSFRPEDSDPRGTSVLRPAYEPWWRKRQVAQEYLAYIAQFAGPTLWATTPQDATAVGVTDALGNPVAGDGTEAPPEPPEPGDEAAASPQKLLLDQLVEIHSHTALVAPFGTEIHTIEMQGDGEPFLLGFAQCDQQITKAILTQTLATEEGQHQARAAAVVHQDVLDTLVRQGKKAVIRMISADLLRPWVAINYGAPAAEELVPVPSLGTFEQRDVAPMMNAVAQLERSGYLAASQRPAIDAKLGLPVRDLEPEPLMLPPPPPGGPPAPAPPEPPASSSRTPERTEENGR